MDGAECSYDSDENNNDDAQDDDNTTDMNSDL